MVHPKDEITFRCVWKTLRFLRHRPTFGLRGRMWGVDCALHQAYKVSVMAPFEKALLKRDHGARQQECDEDGERFSSVSKSNEENISPGSFSTEGEQTCGQPCFVAHSIFGLSRYPMPASLSPLTPSYGSRTRVFAARISGRIGARVPIRQGGK